MSCGPVILDYIGPIFTDWGGNVEGGYILYNLLIYCGEYTCSIECVFKEKRNIKLFCPKYRLSLL
jgi:hypothetical protein